MNARFNVVAELPPQNNLEYCEMAIRIGCAGCSNALNIRAFGDRNYRDRLTEDMSNLAEATDVPVEVVREIRVDKFGPSTSDEGCDTCPIMEANGLVEETVEAYELV